jgi:hypothetical protein
MTRITVPNEVTRQLFESLLRSRDGVELCDSSGLTIGYFTPSADLVLEPTISEEELDRRSKEEPLYSTAEVLAHLRSL